MRPRGRDPHRKHRRDTPIFAFGLGVSALLHAAALAWLALPASSREYHRPRPRIDWVDIPALTAVQTVEPATRVATPPRQQVEEAALPPRPSLVLDAPMGVEHTSADSTLPMPAAGVSNGIDNLARVPSTAPPRDTLAWERAHGQFEHQIAQWLERHREYPLASRRRGEQGTAVVRLRLAADGVLLQAQLVRDSGFTMLDRAALAMVQRAAPYPGVPAELGGAPVDVLVPIQFSLGR